MNLQPAFTDSLKVKLLGRSSNEQLKQLFEWVKTGHISLAVFRDLVKWSTEPTMTTVQAWCDAHDYELKHVTAVEDLNFLARDN